MKRNTLIMVFALLLQISSMAQSCLPEGITFSTQSEIDSFQTNYPGCTVIEGTVIIEGEDISSLLGLNVLTGINGALWISSNERLTGLQGLESLTTIGGYLRIAWNDKLISLDGLNNLDSIGDYLNIGVNYMLGSLEALGNLVHVGAELEIVYNSSLTSLAGLDNIDPGSFTDIGIFLNSSLPDCEVQSICSYLQNPNGVVNIYNNADGCNNPAEVANSCGFTLDCLPYGNYHLFSQAEIDNFDKNYLNCTDLNGDVTIKGDDISDLSGLNSIISIGGDLLIGRPLSSAYNPLLTELNGLEMLEVVRGTLKIAGNENLLNISGLGALDSIGEDLEVSSNPDLNSLIGLGGLDHIGGSIDMQGNHELSNLEGLENITSIGRCISLFNNDDLSDLTGLDNLEEVGGCVYLSNNDGLSSLNGLNKLRTIGDEVRISSSIGLTDFSGLDMLDTIGGSMIVDFNKNLNSFSGLDNLSFIQGDLFIGNNNSLNSLSGLDYIAPGSINNLSIANNQNLSSCDVNSVCEYLSSPGGVVSIYNNASGCDSPPEIATACGFTLSCLPFGNYYIRSQADVDEFFTDYPDCYDLKGWVDIGGDSITDLAGLYGISTVENLSITGCHSLVDLEGLGSLSTIDGNFNLGYWTGSNSIQSLSGLENLTRIGADFQVVYNYFLDDLTGLDNLQSVGGLHIISNDLLVSLNGLENLDSIHGYLSIKAMGDLNDISQLSNLTFFDGSINISYNEALNSLAGLENIESDSIDHLFITDNPYLSHCDVLSICNYLADTTNHVIISDNAPGCNSPEEVEYECTVRIPEEMISESVILYPNPASNTIFISTEYSTSVEEVRIYNLLGQKVLNKPGNTGRIDVSSIPKGLYIIELVANASKWRVKAIIE